jgi:hypothetical protein
MVGRDAIPSHLGSELLAGVDLDVGEVDARRQVEDLVRWAIL